MAAVPTGAASPYSVLNQVLALDEPAGVLSIYVTVRPGTESGRRPSWELELEHGLELARKEVASDAGLAKALDRRLEELKPALSALMAETENGIGRALFATLRGGEPIVVRLAEPFPTRVALCGCANVRPLLAALQAGRAAGVVIVTQEEVRVHEWQLGTLTELEEVPIPPPEERRDLRGPAPAHPRGAAQAAPGTRSGQQRDLHERRIEAERSDFLGRLEDIRGHAVDRDWDLLVLGGEERLVAAAQQSLRAGNGLTVHPDDRLLAWVRSSELAARLAPVIETRRREEARALYERLRDEALAGGRATVGVADTLAVLQEGRVELLLLPASTPLEGAATPAGVLVPAGVEPPGTAASDLRREPLLADRMIQRASATNARVALIDGALEAELDGDAVAARLRW